MSNELIIGGNSALALPDYLQGSNLGVSEGLLATMGAGGNRISLKGNRFRQIVNGKEEAIWDTNYADFIVLGAVPAVSRIFYEGAYNADVKAAPTCYSPDGIAPPDDVKNKQSNKCETCPQNVKGSKIINGNAIKACSYFQRLIVMVAGDAEGIAYQLDVKSMGIFGESHAAQNKYNIRDYTKLLVNRGVDIAQVVTRISFDTDSSVPKLLFTASRYIEREEFELVSTKVHSEEVKRMLQINMSTIDLSGEVDADTPEPTGTAAAQQESKPAKTVSSLPSNQEPAPPQPVTKGPLVMTDKAEFTYDEYVASGWADEDLVAEGYATRPAPPKAAPPPPKAAPAAPPAPKRGPGRPPSAAKTDAAPAAASSKPTPSPAPTPAPRPVPTVSKAHPVPSEAEPVQETTSDAEVESILAGLV